MAKYTARTGKKTVWIVISEVDGYVGVSAHQTKEHAVSDALKRMLGEAISSSVIRSRMTRDDIEEIKHLFSIGHTDDALGLWNGIAAEWSHPLYMHIQPAKLQA